MGWFQNNTMVEDFSKGKQLLTAVAAQRIHIPPRSNAGSPIAQPTRVHIWKQMCNKEHIESDLAEHILVNALGLNLEISFDFFIKFLYVQCLRIHLLFYGIR